MTSTDDPVTLTPVTEELPPSAAAASGSGPLSQGGLSGGRPVHHGLHGPVVTPPAPKTKPKVKPKPLPRHSSITADTRDLAPSPTPVSHQGGADYPHAARSDRVQVQIPVPSGYTGATPMMTQQQPGPGSHHGPHSGGPGGRSVRRHRQPGGLGDDGDYDDSDSDNSGSEEEEDVDATTTLSNKNANIVKPASVIISSSSSKSSQQSTNAADSLHHPSPLPPPSSSSDISGDLHCGPDISQGVNLQRVDGVVGENKPEKDKDKEEGEEAVEVGVEGSNTVDIDGETVQLRRSVSAGNDPVDWEGHIFAGEWKQLPVSRLNFSTCYNILIYYSSIQSITNGHMCRVKSSYNYNVIPIHIYL